MSGITVLAEGLKVSYREPVFSGIGFALNAGAGLGVAGANGSGKTTLLDIVAGLTRPDNGIVKVSGKVGYAPQKDGLAGKLSCLDNLRFFAELCGLSGIPARQRIDQCVADFALEPFLKKRLDACSAGMRQRVSIAAALLPQPSLLLLDEAFSPLDEASRTAVQKTLMDTKRAGTSLLLVSHDPSDFIGLCERVLTMPDGNVRDLTP